MEKRMLWDVSKGTVGNLAYALGGIFFLYFYLLK